MVLSGRWLVQGQRHIPRTSLPGRAIPVPTPGCDHTHTPAMHTEREPAPGSELLTERSRATRRARLGRRLRELPRYGPIRPAPRLLGRQPRARAARKGEVRPGGSVWLRPCRRLGETWQTQRRSRSQAGRSARSPCSMCSTTCPTPPWRCPRRAGCCKRAARRRGGPEPRGLTRARRRAFGGQLTFDAELAPEMLTGLFAEAEVERWNAPLVERPTREAGRDYPVRASSHRAPRPAPTPRTSHCRSPSAVRWCSGAGDWPLTTLAGPAPPGCRRLRGGAALTSFSPRAEA